MLFDFRVSFWLNREATSDRISLGKITYIYYLAIDPFLNSLYLPIDQRDNDRVNTFNTGYRHADRFTKSPLRHSPGLVHFHHVRLLYGQSDPVRFRSLFHKGIVPVLVN